MIMLVYYNFVFMLLLFVWGLSVMIFINVIVTEHFKEHAVKVGIRVILTMFTEAQIPQW